MRFGLRSAEAFDVGQIQDDGVMHDAVYRCHYVR
jgi:hypothetical protein